MLASCDKLLSHFERRIDDLLAWTVRTHVGKDAIDGAEELPHRIKRRVPGIMKRLAEASSAGTCPRTLPGRRAGRWDTLPD